MRDSSSESSVAVGDEVLSPDHLVLATGSVPVIPDVPGAELADTSEDALRFPAPPRSLVIVGGGFIAMEMAGIFASFGTHVHVVERGPRVLSMLDASLARVATARLSEMGVRFHVDSSLQRISGAAGQLSARVARQEATERRSRLRARHLRHRSPSGVRRPRPGRGRDPDVDTRGRLVLDDALRTTNPRVWACGDSAAGMMQTPVASLEGLTVARSIESGTPQVPDLSAVPVACFTTPQLATVGLTIESAEKAGIAATLHRIDSDSLGAAIVDDERDAFFQLVIARATASCSAPRSAGPTASDTIYAAAVAVKARMNAGELQGVLGVHPSYAEAQYYAAW